jgi:hypothetical protein
MSDQTAVRGSAFRVALGQKPRPKRRKGKRKRPGDQPEEPAHPDDVDWAKCAGCGKKMTKKAGGIITETTKAAGDIAACSVACLQKARAENGTEDGTRSE